MAILDGYVDGSSELVTKEDNGDGSFTVVCEDKVYNKDGTLWGTLITTAPNVIQKADGHYSILPVGQQKREGNRAQRRKKQKGKTTEGESERLRKALLHKYGNRTMQNVTFARGSSKPVLALTQSEITALALDFVSRIEAGEKLTFSDWEKARLALVTKIQNAFYGGN